MNMGNVKGFRNVVITSQEFNFFLLMVERFSCNANNFEAAATKEWTRRQLEGSKRDTKDTPRTF